jgi:hypothetical protein
MDDRWNYLCLYSPVSGLGRFLSFLIYTQSVDLLGRGISPSQGPATYIQQQTHTDIHASSGIRTHDPSVRAGEDGSLP